MARHAFYNDKRWKRKRERILRRDKYMCQECKRYGRTTTATTVHHVIPLLWCLSHNSQLALSSINLYSVCSSCHDQYHDRQSDALTTKGLQLVDRIYKSEKPEGWDR